MKKQNCFCAFCKTPRYVPEKKHITWPTVLAVGALSFFAMVFYWTRFEPKVLVFLVVVLGLAEVMVLLRWRLSVKCTTCGFDPVTYLKSPKEACEKVKGHLKAVDEGSELFVKKPSLPTISRKSSAESGQMLSKQI